MFFSEVKTVKGARLYILLELYSHDLKYVHPDTSFFTIISGVTVYVSASRVTPPLLSELVPLIVVIS